MAEFGLPENPFDFKKEEWLQWWSLAEDDGLEYEIHDVISRGSFGVVYRGRDKRTNDTVALKEELGGLSRSTMMEIEILESLPRHPNIVEFKKVLSEGGRILVVMEYLELELNRVREGMGMPFPLHLLKALTAEILKGVAFLHEKGVTHRDLKAANILCGSGNRIKEELGGLRLSTLMEIDILESLPRHPNVLEFKKVLSEGGRILVVMEYLEHDLNGLREGMGMPFPLHLLKALTAEILKGVAFLHEKGVTHRDLKAANILCGSGNRIKICDFGLSARLGSLWGRGVGTRGYKAPEVLDGWHSYTSAVDVWSVGCMMDEFALDKPLFGGRSDAHQLAWIRQMLCGPANLLRLFMSTATSFSGATALTPSGLDLLERLLGLLPMEEDISQRRSKSPMVL